MALGLVYERHAEHLFRVAFGLTRCMGDAEDIVHDLFLSLPKKIGTFEGRSGLETWLRRLTIRFTSRRLRRGGRRDELLREWLADDEPRAHPVDLDRIAIDRALDALPPHYREVVWLKDVEGWTHAEIGEAIGISENTSAKRLHRGRKLMRGLIERGADE